MNRLAILALTLLAPSVALASYSVSSSQWLDSNGVTIYQQVLVDGEYMNCPPALNCAIYRHTPQVYNSVGPNGWWESGGGTCATCYVSFSTTTSYTPGAGELVTANGGGKIQCSQAGTIYQGWLPTIKIKISIANYAYDHNDGKNCYYKLACLSTQPSCYAATWLLDVNGVQWGCVEQPYFIIRTLGIITNNSKTCLGVVLRGYSQVPIPCQ